MSSSHVITITPDSVENPLDQFELDCKRIFTDSVKQYQASTSSVRHLVTVDGQIKGYTHKLEFALELAKSEFCNLMRKLKEESGHEAFNIKIERTEADASVVCKLYYPGAVYGRHKLMTVQIDKLPRLEFPKSASKTD